MAENPLYFAYGSNLSETQMTERCPGSVPLHAARLAGYRLAFGGHSTRRNGGVATILSAAREVFVPGLLYRLTPQDLAALDGWEAYPRVYGRVQVSAEDATGTLWRALTYVLLDFFPNPPSPEYLGIIVEAYRRLGFDPAAARLAAETGRPANAAQPAERA